MVYLFDCAFTGSIKIDYTDDVVFLIINIEFETINKKCMIPKDCYDVQNCIGHMS